MPARILSELPSDPAEVTVDPADLQGNENFSLVIYAPGYATQTLKDLSPAESELALDPVLIKMGPIRITVQNPDGSPAPTAKVWVRTSSSGQTLYIANANQVWGTEGFVKIQLSDSAQGDLTSADPGAGVVAYTDKAIGTATVSSLGTNPVVKLLAMGAVEGDFWESADAATKTQTLALNPIPSGSMPLYQYNLNVSADAHGHFQFPNVPPGEYLLARYRQRIGTITFSHPQRLTVASGATNRIKYGGTGRSVFGQATTDPEEAVVDWRTDVHTLQGATASQVALDMPDPLDFATTDAYQKAINKHQGVLNPQASTYVLDFSEDGSFRAEDLPPGKYSLKIDVTKPKKRQEDYWSIRPEDRLGSFEKVVTIPEGKEPLDLGTIVVPIHGAGTASVAAPTELVGTDLAGHSWSSQSLHGKTAIVVLWATWSTNSAAFLKNWPQLLAEYGKREDVVFVGANLGEESQTVKQVFADRAYSWNQIILAGKPTFQFLERSEINELPHCFVITPEGKIKSGKLDSRRLENLLKRLAAKK